MRKALSNPLPAVVLALLLGACGDSASDPIDETPITASTFDRIQATILTPSCATSGCHINPGAGGGLVLDKAHAYDALVGIAPDNAAARSDGMARVKPADAEHSFLYWKLLFASPPSGREYGSPMPFGTQPLTNGEIEYIRRWIAAGAPKSGNVVDTMVLADRSRFDPTAFTPLAPPAQGYQVHVAPFTIQPFFEREMFVYKPVGNTSEIFVNRIETKMRYGSHHFLLYTMKSSTPPLVIPQANTVRDIRNADGSMNFIAMLPMAYHLFFAGSMTPTSDYRFPEGVAIRVPANASFDLNAHYVNRTATTMTGEAYANLHVVPPAQVLHEAKALDMGTTDITLPPGQRTTITRTFTVTQKTTIFLLTSHMHELGEKFIIRVKGGPLQGQTVYENTNWEHPLMKEFPVPIVLEAGDGLTSVITYNNTRSNTVRFGLTSMDEMGIIFGYYY